MNVSGRILIIDDEAAIRQTLTRILRRAGFEVTSAESGNEALDYLRKQEFDLVYLDIRMPDMSGLEALEIMHEKYPDTDPWLHRTFAV